MKQKLQKKKKKNPKQKKNFEFAIKQIETNEQRKVSRRGKKYKKGKRKII